MNWWESMPDGAWALLGVLVTVIVTGLVERSRRKTIADERDDQRREARREERISAYVELSIACGAYQRAAHKHLTYFRARGSITETISDSTAAAMNRAGSAVTRAQLVSPKEWWDQLDALNTAIPLELDVDRAPEEVRTPVYEALTAVEDLLKKEFDPA